MTVMAKVLLFLVLTFLGFLTIKLFLLANRTNGRAYATVCVRRCRLSVCDVMYCG